MSAQTKPDQQKTSKPTVCGEAKTCVKKTTASKCKAQAILWGDLLKESKDSRADQYRCEGKVDTMGGWVDRYRNERDQWRDAAKVYKEDSKKKSLELKEFREDVKSLQRQRWVYAGLGAGLTLGIVLALRLLLYSPSG